MARIEPIDHVRASGSARELLDELASRGGEPGPMVRAMANAPALLRGYLDLNRAMKRSHLDRRLSERIALAVQEWIGCHSSTPYLAWAAAVGAAGCGRCANALQR